MLAESLTARQCDGMDDRNKEAAERGSRAVSVSGAAWRRRVVRLLGATSVLALTACGVIDPDPLTDEQVTAVVQQDLQGMFADQEPVSGPVTLYEAMARAVKYNLDHRLKVMEEALAAERLTSANLDLLPSLTANAGYAGRSNFSGASSRSLITGVESLEVSTSSDRELTTYDLSLTWNVLDFGVSYVRAQQQADRSLILEERRRKVVQNIIQDVRSAYWNAVTAERLISRVDPLLARVTEALGRAREIERRRLRAPVEALTYRRDLLDMLRQLMALRRDLAAAKTQLAALMNLPVGTDFALADLPQEAAAGTSPDLPQVADDVAALEQAALVHRPEMREEVYQDRISRKDVTASMLQLLPGIELSAGPEFTSNSYTYNNHWWNWGASVTGNLLDLFTMPQRYDAAEAQTKVVETRRMALAMAVMSQVRVSWLDYQQARSSFQTAEELATVEGELLTQSRNAGRAQSQGDLEEIRSEARSLVADLRRDLAYADVRTSLGRLFLSVGADPLPDSVQSVSVDALADALKERNRRWMTGGLLAETESPAPLSDLQAADDVPAAPATATAAPVTEAPGSAPVPMPVSEAPVAPTDEAPQIAGMEPRAARPEPVAAAVTAPVATPAVAPGAAPGTTQMQGSESENLYALLGTYFEPLTGSR